jgi:hypothetical protein
VAGMPLNNHHRWAVCNYCLHGNRGIKLKETEKNKVSFSHKVPCFACIGSVKTGYLIKLDKVNGTQQLLGCHTITPAIWHHLWQQSYLSLCMVE